MALVLLAPIWGYGWVAAKVALQYAEPFTFTALRIGLSAVCLFLVLLIARRPLRPPPLGWTVLVGLLQTTIFVGLFTLALSTGSAGKVAVLTYTMPFWLLLLAAVILGERVRGVQWLAVGLAFAGLVLVVGPWQLRGVESSVLTVLASVSWATSAVVVKLMQRRHQVEVLSLTTWQMIVGAVPLVAIAALAHSGAPQWTPAFVGSLAYTVVLANTLAWMLWVYALHHLSAGAAGLGTLAIPVLGVVASWLQLGERPTLLEGFGMLLIVVGLAVLAGYGLVAGRRGWSSPGEEPSVRPVTD